MAQVIPNLSALSGAATGLGAGLQELASRKVAEMQEREKANQFAEILKKNQYPEEFAQFVTAFPQKDWATALKTFEPRSAVKASQQVTDINQPTDTTLKQPLMQLNPQANSAEFIQQMAQAGKFQPLDAKNLIEQSALAGRPLSPQEQEQIKMRVDELNRSQPMQQEYLNHIQKQLSQAQQQQPQQQIAPQPQIQEPLIKSKQTVKEQLQKQTAEANIQQKIDAQNKPFMDSFRKQAENADNLYDTAKELHDLLKSGQVASGFSGGFQAGRTRLQNDATQRAEKLMEELASFKASSLAGPVTGPKINIGRATKPNLYQSTPTQLYLTERILEQSEPIRMRKKIRDQLITQNDGLQPRNIETLINNKYEKLKKLEPSFDLPEGTQAIDDETNQIIATVRDGEWYPS